MASELTTPFLAGLQASLSVILTIFYGVLATQFNLLSEGAARDISKLCVRMFLPALLITNIGSQLDLDSVSRYYPILVWSIGYNVLCMVFGYLLTRFFKLPVWVTPAIAFNNTTSLPLLLVQSLSSTGILSSILMGSGDNASDAVDRAKSYFLVNAMVGNSLTFSLGPKLLNGHEEDAPDQKKESKDQDEESYSNGQADGQGDIEQARDQQRVEDDQGSEAGEHTSLLPDSIVSQGSRVAKKSYEHGKYHWHRLPPWAQKVLDFLYQFLNAPLIAAVIAAIIGLVPPLHRMFFNESQKGGFFNAWLTTSVKNVGNLFAALQVIVVGVKLSQSMRKMKKGEDSGVVPWTALILVTAIRFVLVPVLSIAIIWGLATKTRVLSKDPILWFAMMLMPTGPPALKLMALAEVNGSNEREKMSIAKFLTISYAVSPLLSFTVVGALKASQAAISK